MGRKKETKRWPVQDAKAHFSEMLKASITRGPQIVTRRGVEMAVLVRVDQWRRLEETTRPRLKALGSRLVARFSRIGLREEIPELRGK